MSELFDDTIKRSLLGYHLDAKHMRFDTDKPRLNLGFDPKELTGGEVEYLFGLIDHNPQLDFYLLTSDPAKLAEAWPEVAKHDGREIINPVYRHNAIIGVPCKTQAEADRLIPELLKLSGLCRGLWVDLRGQAEEICFDLIPISKDTTADVLTGVYTMRCDAGVDHPGAQQEFDGGPRISFVTCGGVDQPIHPQWLRTVRDQCKAAGVALWFDGHGDWLFCKIDDEGDCVLVPDLYDDEGKSRYDIQLIHGRRVDAGSDTGYAHAFVKVGSARSGHQLDGVEHRQVLGRE